MSLNASGVRDTARSLHISPNTVLRALKKKEAVLESVNRGNRAIRAKTHDFISMKNQWLIALLEGYL
jgi:DNA-binding transcriptional regulator YhcF (GntR family)